MQAENSFPAKYDSLHLTHGLQIRAIGLQIRAIGPADAAGGPANKSISPAADYFFIPASNY